MSFDELSLKNFTRKTVSDYLQNLDGHQAENIHSYIMNEIEKGLILEVLDFTKNNFTKASDILGMTRTTLRNKINKHNLFS